MRMTATLLQVWAAYSPVKNSVADSVAKVAAGLPSHSATSGELDIYAANCRHDAVLSPSTPCFPSAVAFRPAATISIANEIRFASYRCSLSVNRPYCLNVPSVDLIALSPDFC